MYEYPQFTHERNKNVNRYTHSLHSCIFIRHFHFKRKIDFTKFLNSNSAYFSLKKKKYYGLICSTCCKFHTNTQAPSIVFIHHVRAH